MAMHRFYPPQTNPIMVYPSSVKQCINSYEKNPFSPPTTLIDHLKTFYAGLKDRSLPLDKAQLQKLALILNAGPYDTRFLRAEVQPLINKMGVLLQCAQMKDLDFYKICDNPKLPRYIEIIKNGKTELRYQPEDLLKYHADALQHIARSTVDGTFTESALNPKYCEKIRLNGKGYEYLVPACHAKNKLQTMTFADRDNPNTIHIASDINIDLIFKHAEHAKLIADTLIALYFGINKESVKNRTKRHIVNLLEDDPEKFCAFAEAFVANPDAVLPRFHSTLTAEGFNYIAQDVIDANAINKLHENSAWHYRTPSRSAL